MDIDISIDFPQPKEKYLYIFNKEICPVPFLNKSLIFGDITIEAEIDTDPEGQVYYVDFYFNDELIYRDSTYPFEWKMDMKAFGRQRINVFAYTFNGEKEEKSLDIIIFNNGIFND
jgi:hypothetical protein